MPPREMCFLAQVLPHLLSIQFVRDMHHEFLLEQPWRLLDLPHSRLYPHRYQFDQRFLLCPYRAHRGMGLPFDAQNDYRYGT